MSLYICDIHKIAHQGRDCPACDAQEEIQKLERKLRLQQQDIAFVNARNERIKDVKETKTALVRIIEFYESRLKAGSTHEKAFESTKNQINVIDSLISEIQEKV